ncbi:MAG: hypothetical protein AAF755_06930 [Pseudomonadota bacterium]
MSDDDMLKAFLADPVKVGEEADLSKAQWSVLRRAKSVGQGVLDLRSDAFVPPCSPPGFQVEMVSPSQLDAWMAHPGFRSLY